MAALNKRLNKTDMENNFCDSEFMQQDSQVSYSFDKIQSVGETAHSEEKIQCFVGERFYISFAYIIYIYIYLYIYIYIYIHIVKVKALDGIDL